MKITIWDKKCSINGISAERVLSDRDDLRNENEVLLVYDDNGNITQTQLPSTLRSILGLDNSVSALEVGEFYLKHLEEVNKQNELNVHGKNDNDIIQELANTKLENIQLKNISEQTVKELSETKLKMIELENKINALGGK